jgi:16S rRNA processing protein RimM
MPVRTPRLHPALQEFPRDEPREGFTAVGRVLKPHGTRGEVRVRPFTPDAPNLQAGKRVYLDGEARQVLRARYDKETWILELEGLTTRAEVEGARGRLLETPDADVQRDDADSYFLHELVGLRVVTADGRELGRVVEVMQPGANDVYVVRGEAGEVLIPAIGEVVQAIDLPVGIMTITPLPGLLDEPE